MNIFKRNTGAQSTHYLYQQLCGERYKESPYNEVNLDEGMAVIEEVMNGWWKPRFLLDHNTQCAYEFMNENEVLMTVTDDDIDWESLQNLPEEAIRRAMEFSFHFPSSISSYENGVAEVRWQLNPDGRYYMDEDGYGMTDDEEIEIYGYIDRRGKIVAKFRNVIDLDELDEMQEQAEKKAGEKE